MILDELMSFDLINLDLNVATKDEFFQFVASELDAKKFIENKLLFIQDLYKREEVESTNLIDQIAIPHSKSDTIMKSSISLYRFHNKVNWEDQKEHVKVAFVLAVSPHEQNVTHLEAIAALASQLMEEEFVELLLQSNDKKDILNYIKEEIGGY